MNKILTALLYQPIFNLLILSYLYLGRDLGIATIAVTLIIRMALWPWYERNSKSQRAMMKLQPKLKEIQTKYKTEPQKQTQEMMALYREYKVNPSGMFLFIFAQFAILIALFKVFQAVLAGKMFELLYTFTPNPGTLNNIFLGFLDLSKPCIYLAIIVALAQFLQTKVSTKNMPAKDKANAFSQQLMLYMMPILIFVIYLKLPSILALYWLVMTIIGIVQEFIINKKLSVKTQ